MTFQFAFQNDRVSADSRHEWFSPDTSSKGTAKGAAVVLQQSKLQKQFRKSLETMGANPNIKHNQGRGLLASVSGSSSHRTLQKTREFSLW